MSKQFTNLKEVQDFIDNLVAFGIPVSDEVKKQKAELLAKEQKADETPIYTRLKMNIGYSEELEKCICTSVEKLLEVGDKAKEPGLLLGKIQSGKTRAFVGIMGLCIDRGIDICIVLTKSTNPLSSQTLSRLKHDFRDFKENEDLDPLRPTINIQDILNIKNGLSEYDIENYKNIIVCKKEAQNLKHLIKLFKERSPQMKNHKVLVIDDEADFASRTFRKSKGEVSMAEITRLIEEMTGQPTYCRYLQVTATPYSLYLQTDEIVEVKNGKVEPFKPRFTTLVPIHDKYIGGQQYFVDSQDKESMYSHLYHKVSDKCMQVLGEKNRTYLKNALSSSNIEDLRYALISYMMAAAIRKIQRRKGENKNYKSSCLIHVELAKKNHDWQKELITSIVDKIKDCLLDGHTGQIDDTLSIVYDDYKESNKKGVAQQLIKLAMPSFVEVLEEMKKELRESDYMIKVVNSDNDVKVLLDDEGQLRLERSMNIFIGGSILDRGITIDRMLSFVYGRNPSNFQQDTVLQHARMYGNRAKGDMAVTRLHTTERIYKALKKMNELDDQLREWFVKHVDDENQDPGAVFVGLDSENHIKPCASSRLIISNTLTIKPQLRLVPYGFQTDSATAISPIVNKIDGMLTDPSFVKDSDGFFEIDRAFAEEIIKLIRLTYIYNRPIDNNVGLDWNIEDMLGCIEYATKDSGGKMYCLQRIDRELSRVRKDGNFIDAPDDGRTDLAPARKKAVVRPVVMFIRENGKTGNGWRGTPFYWPVFVAPQKISPVIFTMDTRTLEDESDFFDSDEMIKKNNIKREEVIKLVLKGAFFDAIKSGEQIQEHRALSQDTAAKYLLKNEKTGDLKLNTKVKIISNMISSIHSYNNGHFPFCPKPYKYILFNKGRDNDGKRLLVKLSEKCPIEFEFEDENDLDMLVAVDGSKIKFVDKNRVQWYIVYNIEKILDYFDPNEMD